MGVEIVIKRLNYELKDGYIITDVDKNQRPSCITFHYKGVKLYVNLGEQYPFHPPRSIHDISNSWSHDNYRLYDSLVSKYKNSTFHNYVKKSGFSKREKCIYCDTLCIDDWAPSIKLIDIINRFIETDKLISNCIKLELIFFRNRQIIELPEDMIFHEIFQYLQ